MQFFHDPVSTTSRAVMLFLADEGLELDMVYVGLVNGEHHAADFAARNPNRLVPVLVDGELVLTECAAILRYLAATTGSAAYPANVQARARVDERLDWFNTNFARDAAYGLAYPAAFPEMRPANPDAAAQLAHKSRQQTERWLEVLDGHWIGENLYVAGPALTLADYLGAAYVELLALVAFDLRPYPRVRGWMDRMHARPHWDEVYAAFDGLCAALTRVRPIAV